MHITAEIAAEQARYIYRNMATVSIGNFIAVCICAAVLLGIFPTGHVLVWLLAFAGQAALCCIDWRTFRHQRFTPPAARRLFRRVRLSASLAGVLWAAVSICIFWKAPLAYQFTMLCGIVLLVVAVVFTYGAHYPTFLAFFIPCTVPVALTLPVGQTALHAGLSGAMGIFIVVMAIAGWRFNRLFVRSLQLRFENIGLLRELTVQKEAAESANRAKSQFLAAASHDLRQPTHALGLFVATLRALAQRAELKRADIEHIAGRLQTTLNSLGQLLNALLDVSRLDAGIVTIEKQAINLQEMLAGLCGEFSGSARAKGLQLALVPTSLWVESDPVVLQRILSNLISNAVRYTERGRVLIGCRRRGGKVKIQVWDTGIGIASDQLPRIFQEFYQVGNVARDREQGLGLGLAIVERSARLLGAALGVRSTPGKGSVFSITLPRAALAPQPAAAPKTPAPAKYMPRRILVIDDDREVLDAACQLLSAWGHAVIATPSLEQALTAADQAPDIGLILADYRLAENMTGDMAIRAVIARLGRAVPAIIITGDTSPERIREANASGFKLLHKPLDPQELQLLVADR
jgi:signal transduction histidine kinase